MCEVVIYHSEVSNEYKLRPNAQSTKQKSFLKDFRVEGHFCSQDGVLQHPWNHKILGLTQRSLRFSRWCRVANWKCQQQESQAMARIDFDFCAFHSVVAIFAFCCFHIVSSDTSKSAWIIYQYFSPLSLIFYYTFATTLTYYYPLDDSDEEERWWGIEAIHMISGVKYGVESPPPLLIVYRTSIS